MLSFLIWTLLLSNHIVGKEKHLFIEASKLISEKERTELECHHFSIPTEFNESRHWASMGATVIKRDNKILCASYERTEPIILPKRNLNLIQPVDPATCVQEIEKRNVCTMKEQSAKSRVGNFTCQTAWFLQQINHKKRKKKRMGDLKDI